MLSSNKDFTFYSKLEAFTAFSHLIALPSTSGFILNNNGEGGHPSLLLIIGGFQASNNECDVGRLLCMWFLLHGDSLLLALLLRILFKNHKMPLNLVNCFSSLTQMIVGVFLQSCHVA